MRAAMMDIDHSEQRQEMTHLLQVRASPQREQEEGFAHKMESAVKKSCYGGKLLPEFYVLGAKNTATSSFAKDLRDLGVKAAPRDERKEWVFFKKHAYLPEAEQFDKWLAALPACPDGRGDILGDFSVTNMVTVPLPEDFVWSQEFGYPAKERDAEYAWDTARFIRDFHSLAEGPMPKMIFLLREPLARMQSEYYHTLPLDNCVGCMANSSFPDSLAFNVELLQRSPPQMTDWAWKSYYARQVENFLQYFNASEFMFVPNREYFEIDPLGFSTEVLKWLGVPGAPWAEASHQNRHFLKPPLDDELPPGAPARLAYEALMAPEEDRLVQAMASAHLEGATLAGYAGPRGDKAQIRAWLEAGW